VCYAEVSCERFPNWGSVMIYSMPTYCVFAGKWTADIGPPAVLDRALRCCHCPWCSWVVAMMEPFKLIICERQESAAD
jgi:hypothetical protein